MARSLEALAAVAFVTALVFGLLWLLNPAMCLRAFQVDFAVVSPCRTVRVRDIPQYLQSILEKDGETKR